MKILKMKSRMAVALIACAGAFAYADDAPEEELVAFGESGLWLGPDEIVVATGEREFALMPPDAPKVGAAASATKAESEEAPSALHAISGAPPAEMYHAPVPLGTAREETGTNSFSR